MQSLIHDVQGLAPGTPVGEGRLNQLVIVHQGLPMPQCPNVVRNATRELLIITKAAFVNEDALGCREPPEKVHKEVGRST